MATPEALTKYYDCLKDSFNKIQVKDNKTALVNAALRPRIREEFAKSKDVLRSYLNYIQVFTLIYSDKFPNICMNIICPIFKEYKTKKLFIKSESDHTDDTADLVHETIQEIIKSKPELAEELVNSAIKSCPAVFSDDRDCFITYLSNLLIVSSYIDQEPLTSLIGKILDRVNPPIKNENSQQDGKLEIGTLIDQSYELLYKYLDELSKDQLDLVVSAILNCFVGDFLASDCEEQFRYLLLYICSLDPKYPKTLIDLLWSAFIDSSRPYEERRSGVCFASSFMSRAKYVKLDEVFNYLARSSDWCNRTLDQINPNDDEERSDSINETTELIYDVVQSILYLITQRYREMYEQESINCLNGLKLDKIINSRLKPLNACDMETDQRFHEVATLYKLTNLYNVTSSHLLPARKRRKSANDMKRQVQWKPAFREMSNCVPDRVKKFYNNYYDHRNFTVYRE